MSQKSQLDHLFEANAKTARARLEKRQEAEAKRKPGDDLPTKEEAAELAYIYNLDIRHFRTKEDTD